MTRRLTTGWRLSLMLVVLVLGLAPVPSPFTPNVALAQSDLSADPKAVSPTVNDLRSGFQFVPEKSEQREPGPRGSSSTKPTSYAIRPRRTSPTARSRSRAWLRRPRTPRRPPSSSRPPGRPSRRLSRPGSSRRSPSSATRRPGLTMEGTSAEGPAVAHLFLFRRGAMVVGITVARPDQADPDGRGRGHRRRRAPQDRSPVPSQTGPRQARQLNTVRPARTPPRLGHSPAGVVGHVDPGNGCASTTPAASACGSAASPTARSSSASPTGPCSKSSAR